MSKRSYLIPLLALAAALSACQEDHVVSPPQIEIPGPGQPVIYSKHIAPIFAASCGGSACHSAGSRENDLVLDSWAQTMAGSSYGAVVIPFSSRKSHLLQHISTDTTIAPIAEPRMPLGRDPLPLEQIMVIKRWIDEGARNDGGEIALAGETRPRVFVTAQSEDKVTAIDLETERIMRYISVGTRPDASTPPESPHNVILSPDGRFLYVNLITAGSIEKYDARTFTKLGAAQVGLSPAQIAVTSNGSTLYVSNFDQTLAERFINKVDAATMVSTKIDEVGRAPHGVVLSRDEKFLYTSNAAGDDISEIDLTTLEVARRIPIVPGSPLPPGSPAVLTPYQGVLTKDGTQLWVSCRTGAQVRLIDLAAGKVIDSVIVGLRPLVLEMTPDERQLWVPNQGDSSVSVVDVASRSVIATIRNIKSQPHAVGFTADGRTAFVSCENTNGADHHPTVGDDKAPGLVYVIDVATRSVRRTIEVGSFAAGVAVGR